MNEPADAATWRNRYILMSLVQVGGSAIVLFGLALGRPGFILSEGWPITGFVLAGVGLITAFFAPRRLARRWRQQG